MIRYRNLPLLSFVLFSTTSASCRADETTSRSWDMLTAKPEAIQAWQDMRYGMFVCWGPVALTGQEIGWSRGKARPDQREGGGGPTPAEVYDSLYQQWKPDHFDARQWVRIAQEGGMKYMIFLVKHHDGFCLYDSKLTDYKSTGPQAAWNHDVMRDIADACHAAGLELIVYYSQPDWHHPDYRTANHARYIQYLHGQMRELLSNYGRIDGLWFDLGGKPEDWDSVRLFRMMRTLQPWLVINNRCGLPGDFDTPEQRLGVLQLDRPWESCITLGTQWSWKPDDRLKSLKHCVDLLVICAGHDGNLALNTNPMPDGRIEPRQAERFREIGNWLRQYGESIYGTRGGPFWGMDCASTRKGNRVYVHVLRWRGEALRLPGIPSKIVASRLLTGGPVRLAQSARGIEIEVAPEDRHGLDTIVVLELDGPAAAIKPAMVAPVSLTFNRPVTVSSFYPPRGDKGMGVRHLPEFAVDGDPDSTWCFDCRATPSAWLEVDLGRACRLGSAEIREAHGRVRSFRIQAKQEDRWATIHEGTRIGEDYRVALPPVTARFVRLKVLDVAPGPYVGPQIAEFHLYPAETSIPPR